MLDHEVADADRTDLAVGEQPLQGTVGLERSVERGGQRLVQDQQGDLFDAELSGALLETVERLVVSVVADPDLGLQEHIRWAQVGGVDGVADLALVAVGGGGVDVPVSGGECRAHRVAGLIGRGLKDAQAEDGHLHAVVEGDRFHGVLWWSAASAGGLECRLGPPVVVRG